jgi:tetratricopeptide (TPR) repeat protein
LSSKDPSPDENRDDAPDRGAPAAEASRAAHTVRGENTSEDAARDAAARARSDASETAEEGGAQRQGAPVSDAEVGSASSAPKSPGGLPSTKPAKAMSPGARLAAQRAAKAAAKAAKKAARAAEAEAASGVVAGPRKPDAVDLAAARRAAAAEGWFHEHRTALLAAVVAIVLAFGGFLLWEKYGHARDREAAAALVAALQAANGVVSADTAALGALPSDVDVFPTEEARATRALELFREVTGKHAGTAVAAWARLGEAKALLDLGKPTEAREAFQKALREARGDVTVEARAQEGLAFTFEAEGKPDQALEHFQALLRVGEGAFRDLAEYHLARVYLAKGERGRAKDTLRTLVQRLRERDDDPRIGASAPYVRYQAELRLAELDPSAVPRGPGGVGTGWGPGGLQLGGGDGPSRLSQEQIEALIRNLQRSASGASGGGSGAPE